MASKPSIGRTLCEIPPITNADVGDGRFLVIALWKDDLPSVRRLLSSGLNRPWDEEWGGRNLLKSIVPPFSASIVTRLAFSDIQMAAWFTGDVGGEVVDLLLPIIGESADISGLQFWIWMSFADQHFRCGRFRKAIPNHGCIYASISPGEPLILGKNWTTVSSSNFSPKKALCRG